MTKPEIYYSNSRSEIVPFVPKEARTVLDIGCGKGHFLKQVRDTTGAETWGVETEKGMALEASSNADKIITGNVESIIDSIPDKYFDCIVFNDILEHIIYPENILINIKPKLSDIGIIVASIPNVRYISNLIELVIHKDWEYKEDGILDSTHMRFFTQKSMVRLFEKAQLKVIRQVGINELVSWKQSIFQAVTLGFFRDSKYLQIVCIAIPNK
jgi:2-polyprenyl-3-methyl-5-hydroxy-6-metoxy-1,4-benzoquinol methylase